MPKKGRLTFLKTIPQAPSSLSEKAKEHWDWIVPMLVDEEVLKPIDLPIIAAACDLYADYLAAKNLSDKKAAIGAYDKLMVRFDTRKNAAPSEGGRTDAIAKMFD